jgi:hypothetical protein
MPVEFIDAPQPVAAPPGGYDHYPTGDDLQGFLIGSSMALPPDQDLDGAAQAGVEYFESMTDRLPMLAASGTRLFDLPQVTPGGILDFGADLVSLTKVTIQGTEILPGQYYLRPNDAPNRRRPYARLQLMMPYGFYANAAFPPLQYFQAISIEGLWGYGTLIPADAWRAMLRAAALDLVFGGIDPGDGSGPLPPFLHAWTAISRSSATYDNTYFWKQKDEWWKVLDATVGRYQRIAVG